MDERRIDLALNRIEAAFSRVEEAAAGAIDRQGTAAPRDEALRQRVGSALAELDDLIASLDR